MKQPMRNLQMMQKKPNGFLTLTLLLLISWTAQGQHYLNIRAWNFTGCDFGQWGSQNAQNMIVLDYNGSRNNGVQGGWPNIIGTYHLFSSNAVAGVYTLFHRCEWLGTSPEILLYRIDWDGTYDLTLDWYVFDDGCPGCSQSNPCTVEDLPDGLPKRIPDPDPDCEGMARWRVSQPNISLALRDHPFGYQPGAGPRVSFDLNFKQRGSPTGLGTNMFNVGKNWNCSWLSYVYVDGNGSNVVVFAGGGQRTFSPNPDYLSGAVLTGDAYAGFTLSYPDLTQEVFEFRVTNNFGGLDLALLSQRINPSGQYLRFNYASYNPTNPIVRLLSVVDGDGLTNTISYNSTNPYCTNLVSQVTDPFGRSCYLGYDNSGHLTSITDFVGVVSSFLYDTNDWATNLSTPYGTTSFAISGGIAGSYSDGRSINVTEPDGGHQLYLCKDFANGVASTYSDGQMPNTGVWLPTAFETGDMNVRNTFHWGRLQYAALSTTDPASMSANDFRKARMRHWLKNSYRVVGQTLSMERAPSPDSSGNVEGPKIWYSYYYQPNPAYEGLQTPLPLFAAQLLPDSTTRFTHSDRLSSGVTWKEISTWSSNNVAALRTNRFSYSGDPGDLLGVTNALGAQVSANVYNAYHQVTAHYDALNQQTTYTYDANRRLTSVTLPSGLVATNTHFNSGVDTNRIKTVVEYALVGGSPVYYRTNSYTYTNGLVRTHTDALGLTVTTTWDDLQRLRCIEFPDGTSITNSYANLDLVRIIDRMGFTNAFGYDSLQRLIEATNANATVTRFGYCSCGSLQSQTNAFGTAVQAVTQNTFNNQGLLTSVTNGDGSSVAYGYDSVQQLTSIADGANRAQTFVYNNQGMGTTVSNAYGRVQLTVFDILDRPIQVTDANGVTVTNSFDSLNRRVTISYPSGGGTEVFLWGVNGLLAHTNQNQKATLFNRDPAFRLLSQTNANQEVTWFKYNPLNQMTDLWDGNSNHTTFAFNQYGWLMGKTNALREILRLARDPNGRVTNRWTPEFGSATYVLDPVGNRKAINYPPSTNSYSFDALNRLTNMTDQVGTTAFTFTQTSQPLTEDGPWSNDTLTFGYAQGLRTSLSLNSQPSTLNHFYSYDSARRLSALATLAGTFNYGYNVGQSASPASLVRTIGLPNAAYITNHFDGLNRQDYTALVNYWNHPLDGYSYTYDLLGLRTNIVRDFGLTTNTVAVGYDSIEQITSWVARESDGSLRLNEQLGLNFDPAHNMRFRTNGALVQTFNVDRANELTNITRTGPLTVSGALPAPATNVTVNGLPAERYADLTFAATNLSLSATNAFTNIAANAYGLRVTNTINAILPSTINCLYDSNGNLTNDGTRSFQYSPENQLTNVYVPGQWKSEFVYDGLGRRRIEFDYNWNGAWNKTNELHFIYDGWLLVQTRDANNNVLVTFVRGLDLSGTLSGAGGIGGLLARTDTSGTTFYHADGAGNITALIDSQQNIAARYLYNPFGKLNGKWGPLADANTMQFSSMPVHQQSGIVGYPFRFYDPVLQRFLSQDPIGETGGINLYGLARNNALRYADPFGLQDKGFLEKLSDSVASAAEELERSGEFSRIQNDVANVEHGVAKLFSEVTPLGNLWQGVTGLDFDGNRISKREQYISQGLFTVDAVMLTLGIAEGFGERAATASAGKTPCDLYAFGSRGGPRLPRPFADFGVEGLSDTIGPEIPPLPKGASTFSDLGEAPLSGHYHVLPAGTELPPGVGAVADGSDVVANSPHLPSHHTLYPTEPMTVAEFHELLQRLPFGYGGKK